MINNDVTTDAISVFYIYIYSRIFSSIILRIIYLFKHNITLSFFNRTFHKKHSKVNLLTTIHLSHFLKM